VTEAKLVDVNEERRKWTRNGRRIKDALAEANSVIKLVTGMVGELLKLFLAAVGAGGLGYAMWQDTKSDIARHATPPALVKPQEGK